MSTPFINSLSNDFHHIVFCHQLSYLRAFFKALIPTISVQIANKEKRIKKKVSEILLRKKNSNIKNVRIVSTVIHFDSMIIQLPKVVMAESIIQKAYKKCPCFWQIIWN